VAIGETPTSACLREPAGLADTPAPPPTDDRPVHYRLEVAKPEAMVVGCSEVGGLPIAAPPGRGTIVVELDPPLRVEGPFAPGQRHVLQVIDFPALDPATRHWRWAEPQPAAAAHGADAS